MRILVTGGTGCLGRFVVAELARAGHDVTLLGRSPLAGVARIAWRLGDAPDLPEAEALVHLAFDHVPGAYRGGEGDDPQGFWRRNFDGSCALFEAALRAGAGRLVFLSSRSVYGDHRRGEILRETDAPAPDSLYGRLKLATEREMARIAGPRIATSIRATGIYGRAEGAAGHKWAGLFADFLAGREIAGRIGTELHGDDLAAAILRLLETPPARAAGVFNASDILLDRHDLLARVKARTGSASALPPAVEGPPPGIMATEKLEALGWRPGGEARLERFLDGVLCGLQSADRHQTSGAQPIQSP